MPILHPLSKLAVCGLFVAALGASEPARAGDVPKTTQTKPLPKTPVGFSKLLVRLDGRDDIGIVGEGYQVRLLERMREKGFHAVGAEDLVFGKDESRSARFVVGGVVRELECVERAGTFGCRIGVEWQLLDVARDAITYSVVARALVRDLPSTAKDRMGGMLLTAAMDRLLDREAFQHALDVGEQTSAAADPTFSRATLGRCAAGKKIADGAEDLLRATVVVKTNEGFGSGFLVSPDGLVVTAAHVLTSSPKVRLREGSELDAQIVRVAKHADVALIRTTKPLEGHRCASLRLDPPAAGVEVYAAGAPATLDLAFSLARGIVSGLPEIEGRRRVQTDAPLNPGNSGGPLADGNGDVVGVVSFKLVGGKIEGVGFAVPMRETLDALGLTLGDRTDERLATERADAAASPEVPRVTDVADPIPSLDPEADLRRAREEEAARRRADLRAREQERDRITPGYVPAMRWTGVVVGAVGAVGIVGTYFAYDAQTTTPASFRTLRAVNTIGWSAFALGGAAFGLSYVLRPALPASVPVTSGSSVRLGVGSVIWEGTF